MIFARLEYEKGVLDEHRVLLGDGETITQDFYWFKDGEKIVKESKNIIDVIEVGDIVEVEDMGNNKIIHINDDRYLEDFKGYVANEYFEVKSLLTREQFESMKYVVGDK